MGVLFHGVNLLMVGLFAFSAYVNLNDPDPWMWVALYSIAALVSAAAWRPIPPAAFHGLTLVAALAMIPTVLFGETGHPMPFFENSGVLREEMVRELLGLGLVIGWMQVLAWRARRQAEVD